MYIPDRGDLVWLDFFPQKGHEQAGRRPGVIISKALLNEKNGLVIICPITSQVKGYPFEVVLEQQTLSGAVLVDQVKSLDWQQRNITFVEKINGSSYQELEAKLRCIMFEQ